MSKPRVLVACVVFPEVLDKLRQHFEVEAIAEGEVWHQGEFARRLADKQGAYITGGHRIDAALLAACPQLKTVAKPRRPFRKTGPSSTKTFCATPEPSSGGTWATNMALGHPRPFRFGTIRNRLPY